MKLINNQIKVNSNKPNNNMDNSKKITGKRLPTEFALNMNMNKAVLLQQEDLPELKNYNYFDKYNPCHIYFICKRPRISIDPNEFKVNETSIELNFKVQRQNEFIPFKCYCENPTETTNIRILSEYPYSKFQILADEELYTGGSVAHFLQQNDYRDYLDLEILYIGQSYGVEGARTAPDRLKSHSTLQSIYAESLTKNPDSEIWLILASFELILITVGYGKTIWSEEEIESDDTHRKNVINKFHTNNLNEQQQINFAEAALIRYFEPRYNFEYKASFPSPAHKTYSECYELDINAVNVELNTFEMLNCCFYSEKINRQPTHFAMFNLNSLEERKSMFDLFT